MWFVAAAAAMPSAAAPRHRTALALRSPDAVPPAANKVAEPPAAALTAFFVVAAADSAAALRLFDDMGKFMTLPVYSLSSGLPGYDSGDAMLYRRRWFGHRRAVSGLPMVGRAYVPRGQPPGDRFIARALCCYVSERV